MSDEYRERVLDRAAMLVLDRARFLCGGHVGPAPECLPPDIEQIATDAFRRMAEHLEALLAVHRHRTGKVA